MVWSRLLVISLLAGLIFCGFHTETNVDKFEAKLTELEKRAEDLESLAVMLETKVMQLLQPRTRLLQVTGYSPRVSECDSTPYINAYNKRVRPGTVAVSPDLFKKGWAFGREVYIKGYGVFVIEDLMNPRHTDRMDIFMWDTQRAIKFGNKFLEVTLLGG